MEIPFIIRQGGGATFSAKFAAPRKSTHVTLKILFLEEIHKEW